jgi:hypothetical protein
MMKNLLAITLFASLSSGFVTAMTDYETDQQTIFVKDTVNEKIEMLSDIVCYISSMRPEEFVNDGNYFVTVYGEDCQTGLDYIENVVNVTRDSNDAPVNIIAWMSPKIPGIDTDLTLFIQIEQTAGVSPEAPNGEFEMLWSNFEPQDKGLESRFNSLGYLKVDKNMLTVTLDNKDEDDLLVFEKMSAFYRDNGDIAGGFSEVKESNDKEDESDYLLFYSFFINDSDNSFCKKLVAVDKINFDAIEIQTMTSPQNFYSRITTEPLPEAEYKKKRFITDEKCYSTKIKDSSLDVYDYGVYNPDGSRLIAEESSFLLVGQVTNEKSEVIDVRAFVYPQGAFVLPQYQQYLHLLEDTTEFRKLNLYGQSPEEIYYLRPKDIEVELVEPRYLEEDDSEKNRFQYFSERLLNLAEIAAMDGKPWYCVKNCVTRDSLDLTMSQINNFLENNGDAEGYDFSQVASPYEEYGDVVEKSELLTFNISDAGLKDSDGKLITLSAALKGRLLAVSQKDKDSMASLQGEINKYFIKKQLLISADDLEKLKCDDEGGNYCPDQFSKADFDSYYNIQLNFLPKFVLYNSLGKPANLKPRTLYYDVPESEGMTAGKIKLTYHNHGDLKGIPEKKRYVYKSETSSTYTIVDRISIPDGAELKDDKGNTFKVKVLDAGRDLGISDGYKGRYDHSLDVDSIRSLRPKLEGYDHAQKLKSKPANKDIINDGKISVARGKVVYDPTPDANTQ